LASGSWETMIEGNGDGAVELYYDNDKKLSTGSVGLYAKSIMPDSHETYDLGQNMGRWNDLYIADDGEIRIGQGNDLKIYHSGGENFIRGNGSASPLYIDCCENLHIRHLDTDGSNSETMIKAVADGAVELYYDNVKTFQTNTNGVIVQATEGGDANLFLYADEGDDNVDKWLIQSESDGYFALKNNASGSYETSIKATGNGNVELYYDGTKMLETYSNGVKLDQGANSHLWLSDNSELRCGTGNDLKIYHDGSHSYIKDAGTGNLIIRNGNDDAIICNTDGSVDLFHDNVKKAETVSGGFTVSGTCTATAFAGDGSNLSGIEAFVTGMILLWSGASNAIPSGFVLCNGSNSTPDLRDRFVVGAGNSYSVGATGGSANVTLSANQIAAHGHSFSANTGNQSANHSHGSGNYNTSNTGGHSHSGNTNNTGAHSHTWDRQDAANDQGYRPWPASNNDCARTTANTSNNGNHSHNISTNNTGNHSHNLGGNSGNNSANHTHSVSGNTGNSGNTAAHENRPPYYALCYIMKT